MGLVVRRSIRLAVWGIVVGMGGVWASTRVLEGLVYGEQPLDTLTIVGCCVLLGLVTVAAAVLPARRAVNVPPALVLKTE
jgi:ABC-type lipoprotein release transport system permease subunit